MDIEPDVTENPKRTLRTIALVLGLIGLVFFFVGAGFLSSLSKFKGRSVEAELLVVHVDRKMDDDGDLMFKPRFQAISDTGRSIEYQGNGWVSPKPHDKGDRVAGRVDWDAGDMRSDKMMWMSKLFGSIFGALGAVLMVAAAFVFPRKKVRRVYQDSGLK